MTNQSCIEAARAALARAAWARGAAPAYDETAVADLLADLRHFCKAAGVDYDSCNQRAENYFIEEEGGHHDPPSHRRRPAQQLHESHGGFSRSNERWAERAARGMADRSDFTKQADRDTALQQAE